MSEVWPEVRLGDISDIVSGVGFPPALQGRETGDFPLAKVGDVSAVVRNGNGLLGSARHWIDRQDLPTLRAKPLPVGSIVFAKIGEAISQNFRAITTREIVVDNNVMALVPRQSLVDPRFLLHFTRSQDWYPLAVATTIPSLRKTDLAELRLRLPPLAVQRTIIARLDDQLSRSRRAKDALDAVPPLLEKLRQSILAAAFRGDLTAEWRKKNPDVEPADKLLARIRVERRKKWEQAELAKMKAKGKTPTDDRWKAKYQAPEPVNASELSELPETWTWGSLDELSYEAPIVYGIIQPGEEDVRDGVAYVRPLDITDQGTVDFDSMKKTSHDVAAQYSRSKLQEGDLVLSIVGTIGKIAITPEELNGGNITQSSARIRSPSWMPPVLLRYLLQAPVLTRQYEMYRFGNAVQRLNLEHVRRLAVPLAPEREQSELLDAIRRLLGGRFSAHIASVRARLIVLQDQVLMNAFTER